MLARAQKALGFFLYMCTNYHKECIEGEPYEKGSDIIEIDLLALARAVWKRIWLVILRLYWASAAAFSYAAFLVTPLYEAKAMMYVNNSALLSSTFISIPGAFPAQSLVETYIVILKSRLNLEAVIEKAELPYTYEELELMITAQGVNETEIFEVIVTDSNPQEAELIANTIAEVLPQKISDIVEGSSVRIVDYAVVPAYPVSPSITKITMIGFLLGGFVSVGIIVLMELLNESIRSEDYLLQTYDLPILAVIPVIGSSNKSYGQYETQSSYQKSAKNAKRRQS